MITILFFAQLQEEIGPSLQLDCSRCSVQDIRNHIQHLYPHVSISSAMSAVNEEFALPDDIVEGGDVVAFLPPVSGG